MGHYRSCGYLPTGLCGAYLGVLIAPGVTAQPSFAESLGDVLSDYGIGLSDLPSGHAAGQLITSYEVLSQPDLFAIAYYYDDGSGVLQPPLQLLRYDEGAGRWQGTTISEIDVGPENTHCFGSVVSGNSTSNALYFTTHITPSASCTFVISPELLLQAVVYGWPLGSYADGTIIYHDSMVHFAPTHPARLSLYKPGTGESRTIYPIMPYRSIRAAHMRRLAAVYDDPAWCNQQNHHCDPEQFDNSIAGPIAINDDSDALAFVSSFSRRELAMPEETPEPPTQVLYVYRNVRDPDRIAYRELLLEDFRTQYGELPLAEALSPDILDPLFSD